MSCDLNELTLSEVIDYLADGTLGTLDIQEYLQTRCVLGNTGCTGNTYTFHTLQDVQRVMVDRGQVERFMTFLGRLSKRAEGNGFYTSWEVRHLLWTDDGKNKVVHSPYRYTGRELLAFTGIMSVCGMVAVYLARKN